VIRWSKQVECQLIDSSNCIAKRSPSLTNAPLMNKRIGNAQQHQVNYVRISYDMNSVRHGGMRRLADASCPSSDLGGVDLDIRFVRNGPRGHTNGFPPLRLMVNDLSDPTVVV
jgi:hypothetical protein